MLKIVFFLLASFVSTNLALADGHEAAIADPAEISFVFNTLLFCLGGFLVMWMAAGFTMLEAGLVQKKDVSEIVTKNLGLYSIACIMYLVCGFALMYSGYSYLGGLLPHIDSSWSLSTGTEAEPLLYGHEINEEVPTLDIRRGPTYNPLE